MSPEAWIALAGFLLTILVIVYQAGQLSAKIENLAKTFASHAEDDREIFTNIFNRVNAHGEDISALKTESALHFDRK